MAYYIGYTCPGKNSGNIAEKFANIAEYCFLLTANSALSA